MYILFSLLGMIVNTQSAQTIGDLTQKFKRLNDEDPPSFEQTLKELSINRKDVNLVKGGLGEIVMKYRCAEKNIDIYLYFTDGSSGEVSILISIYKHNASTNVDTPLWSADAYIKKRSQPDPTTEIVGRIKEGFYAGDMKALD